MILKEFPSDSEATHLAVTLLKKCHDEIAVIVIKINAAVESKAVLSMLTIYLSFPFFGKSLSLRITGKTLLHGDLK